MMMPDGESAACLQHFLLIAAIFRNLRKRASDQIEFLHTYRLSPDNRPLIHSLIVQMTRKNPQ
jgi:hypothetical protein